MQRAKLGGNEGRDFVVRVHIFLLSFWNLISPSQVEVYMGALCYFTPRKKFAFFSMKLF